MGLIWMLISWTVFGFIVGGIARFLVPGPQPMGFLGTTLLGVAGAFVGGFLGSLIFGGQIQLSNPAGWVGGIIGAVVVLVACVQLGKRKPIGVN